MANENNSSVIRVHKNGDFTIMCNHHLRNTDLTLKAVGLMSKMLSLPDDWNYSISGLVKICKEGETAVRSALDELRKARYVYVEKLSPGYSKSGRFEYIYHIYEVPYKNIPDGLEHPELYQNDSLQNKESPVSEKQDAENLCLENQGVGNQAQLNTNISSTKELSTKKSNIMPSANQNAEPVSKKSASKKSDNKKNYADAVRMTEEEYKKLTEKHSEQFVAKCIETLNNYKLSSGKRYKSDYHTILNWVVERVSKDYPQLDQPVSKMEIYDNNANPFDQFLNEQGR